MFENIILCSDSYKISHYKQYCKGTTRVYSYFESRGGAWDEVVFFGLQYYLDRYLQGPVITSRYIKEAQEISDAHFGDPSMFNLEGWEHILYEHGGRLPLSIKS